MNGPRTCTPDAGAGSVPEGFERLYTPQQLAQWLSVDESTVRRWFHRRPGVIRLGGAKFSTIRIPQSVLEGFIRERAQ